MWSKLAGGLEGERCCFHAQGQLSTDSNDGTNHLSVPGQATNMILTSKVVQLLVGNNRKVANWH